MDRQKDRLIDRQTDRWTLIDRQTQYLGVRVFVLAGYVTQHGGGGFQLVLIEPRPPHHVTIAPPPGVSISVEVGRLSDVGLRCGKAPVKKKE